MAIGATSLILVISCAATLTTIALYSSPYQVGEPFVPLTGRLISDVTVDGITRLCHDGDDACLLTGLSDATPDDANQIVYLKDIPTVDGGKELSKFRNGCGMSHSTNAMGDIVLSPLITAGNGLSTVPGCGEGDPIILEVNISDLTTQLDVEYISDTYITDKCAIAHAYNNGTSSIEFGVLIEGNDGITVGACPDGGAQQLGLNGTAVVEALDLKHLAETFFADVCGITYDYDSTGDKIFSTLQFVGLDGVTIDANCSIPGGPIEIGLNGTLLVETINTSYFSENKLVATCGLEQTYDSMLDAIVLSVNMTGSDGVVLGQPCGDDAALNIGLNGTALVDTLDLMYFSSAALDTECGLSQYYDSMLERVVFSLDLFSMDSSLLFNYSCDTGQLSICVNESRILQNVNASEVLNVLFEPGCGLMLEFIPPNDMIRFSVVLVGTNGIIIDPMCGVGDAQIISLDSEGVVDAINITYFNELYMNPLCGITSVVNGGMIELGLNITGSAGVIIDAPCGDDSALNIALDSEGVVDAINITYFNEIYVNPLCGLTSVVNNDMIELSLDVTGSDGIRIDAPCGPLDALNIGLNGTEVIDSLDVKYLVETLFADVCGISFDYDSTGNQIFSTLDFVGFDGVVIDANCSLPGGPIEISINGTLLVETIDIEYFSDNKLVAECGITQVYDGFADTIVVYTDIAAFGGIFLDPACPGGVQTLSLDPNGAVDALNVTYVYELWFENGCGITTDLSMGKISNNLDLTSTDGSVTISTCSMLGQPVDLSLPTVTTSRGGTGLTTAPDGFIMMGSGGVWILLAPGAVNQVLTANGVGNALTWTTPTTGTVTSVSALSPLSVTMGTETTTPEIVLGIVPVTKGGTGLASVGAAESLLISTGPATAMTTLPPGTPGFVLTMTGSTTVAWLAPSGGGVSQVTASSPLSATPGSMPDISLTGIVTVTNGGTGLGALGTGYLLFGSAGPIMNTLIPGSINQVLTMTSATTFAWVAPSGGGVASVTATSPIFSSGGPNPDISLGTVPVTLGGTGLTSVGAAQSLLISTGPATAMTTLPISTPGYVLTVTGTSTVAWLPSSGGGVSSVTATSPLSATPGSTPVISLGIVQVANGGTGLNALAAGSLLVGSGLATMNTIPINTNGFVLTMVAGLPAWAASAGGGGGTLTGITAGPGITVTPSPTSPTVSLTSPVTAILGGTGFSNLVGAGRLLVSSSATAFSLLAPTTNGFVLTLSAGLPVWQASASAGVTSVGATTPLASTGGTTPVISLSGIVPVANGGTGIGTHVAAGKLLVSSGVATPMTLLSPSTVGFVLTSLSPTSIGWTAVGTLTGITAGTNIAVTPSPTSPTVSLTGTVAVTNGGTGINNLGGAGRLLLSTSTTAFSLLPASATTGFVLTTTAANTVAWAAPPGGVVNLCTVSCISGDPWDVTTNGVIEIMQTVVGTSGTRIGSNTLSFGAGASDNVIMGGVTKVIGGARSVSLGGQQHSNNALGDYNFYGPVNTITGAASNFNFFGTGQNMEITSGGTGNNFGVMLNGINMHSRGASSTFSTVINSNGGGIDVTGSFNTIFSAAAAFITGTSSKNFVLTTRGSVTVTEASGISLLTPLPAYAPTTFTTSAATGNMDDTAYVGGLHRSGGFRYSVGYEDTNGGAAVSVQGNLVVHNCINAACSALYPTPYVISSTDNFFWVWQARQFRINSGSNGYPAGMTFDIHLRVATIVTITCQSGNCLCFSVGFTGISCTNSITINTNLQTWRFVLANKPSNLWMYTQL